MVGFAAANICHVQDENIKSIYDVYRMLIIKNVDIDCWGMEKCLSLSLDWLEEKKIYKDLLDSIKANFIHADDTDYIEGAWYLPIGKLEKYLRELEDGLVRTLFKFLFTPGFGHQDGWSKTPAIETAIMVSEYKDPEFLPIKDIVFN